MTEDIIKAMGEDIAPKNMDEFYLGMILAGIVNVIQLDDDEFDPELLDDLVDQATPALEYWRDKYDDEIFATIGKKRQGPSRREQKLL